MLINPIPHDNRFILKDFKLDLIRKVNSTYTFGKTSDR